MPAMRTGVPSIGPRPGQARSGWASGVLVSVGVPVAGDLLAGDGVEESVSVAGDDHDEVVPAVGVDGEAGLPP